MSSRFFLVLCENGTKRDEEMLRRVLTGAGVIDMKIIPREHGVLDDKSARLVQRHRSQNPGQDLRLVIHVDGDENSLSAVRASIDQWAKANRLDSLRLVRCVPIPCTERWLCLGGGLTTTSIRTRNPGDPWKRRWERERVPEWKRLEGAASALVGRRKSIPDLAAFFSDLDAALA